MRATTLPLLALVLTLAGLAATPAQALDAEAARAVQVRPQLDSLPDELDGLLVTLRQTPQPQISVHNLTGDALEILDHAERPYLRLGPQDTEANFANAWFHRARYAGDAALPDNTGGAARWHKIDSGPAFAWWDPRLRIDDDLQPPAGVTRGGPKFLRRWRIPVRLGDVESHISGYFLYRPAPGGVRRSEIANPSVIGEDVAVLPLLEDDPGVFIANYGNAEFMVRGIEDEPLLRFVPGKVMVNPNSPTWKQAAPANAQVPYAGPGKPRWVVVSSTAGFGWSDPRLDAEQQQRPEEAEPKQLADWEIPVQVDGDNRAIEGHTWWLPQTTSMRRGK